MRIPHSTYRLQLTPEFGFAAARARLDYLQGLGIGDLYLSPIFQATPDSAHGYDVVDPNRVSEALGGEAAFRALAEEARDRGMGVLVDFVPNHMAARWENPWWRDVLTHGRASRYADFFDIDWDRPAGPAKGKVVLPVLGKRYVDVLEAGEMGIEWNGEVFLARYFERRLPLDPATWPRLFRGRPGAADPPESLVEALYELGRLPSRDTTNRFDQEERAREADRLACRVGELVAEEPAVRDAVDRAIARHDATDPSSRDRLDALLVDQPWWLVYWKHASEEINYRRFFTIADLVGVAVEREEVFRATHAKLRELIDDDLVTGVRVDHVDGLDFPAAYLERLRALGPEDDLYVVVEKILARREDLPERWPVGGTTGYDFLGMADGLAVDPDGVGKIERVYRMVTGTQESFPDLAHRTRREVAEESFAGELRALADALLPHVRRDPRGRDVTARQVREALVDVTASMPVYRTYMCEAPIEERDRRALEVAFARARERTGLAANAWEVVWRVLSLEGGPGPLEVCRRWQQLSGAIMAKGVEDTAFYAYTPLLSLNEVGTDPAEGATTAAGFHDWARSRLAAWPGSLNATSTHDTKRSEDVRARIAALSWRPDEWAGRLERWRAWNASKKTRLDGESAPSPAREMALYQTLLGAWPDDPAGIPAFIERLETYLPKAIREARLHGDWEEPDTAYEEAVVGFARRILEGARELVDGPPPESIDEDNPFLADFLELRHQLARDGLDVSLAWTALKVCAPGVPDIYQGCEAVRLSLVDPDNRRAVEWGRLEKLLRDEVASGSGGADAPVEADETTRAGEPPSGLVTIGGYPDPAAWDRLKMRVLHRALAFRAQWPPLFERGDYLPLEVEGPAADGVVAFARRLEGRWAISVARVRPPRRSDDSTAGREGEPRSAPDPMDGRVRLPDEAPRSWERVLDPREPPIETDGTLPLGEVLAGLPVAVLSVSR